MKEHCSFQAVVGVKVEDGQLVRLRLFLGSLEFVAVLRPEHGKKLCRLTQNGWMAVKHPKEGWLGLPLEGERNSWHAAWDEGYVAFIALAATGKFVEIEDWQELRRLIDHI